MDREKFYQLVQSRIRERMDLLEKKGKAYSGTGDVFDNFKRNAEAVGISKYQIWLVYFSKHIDAIRNAVKQNPEKPVDKSEGLLGRIDDAINYLDLLVGMVIEDGVVDLAVNDPVVDTIFDAQYTYFDLGLAHEWIHKEVEYQQPGDQVWYKLNNDTKKEKFVPGTRFRRAIPKH
jgi:hypothetical protein